MLTRTYFKLLLVVPSDVRRGSMKLVGSKRLHELIRKINLKEKCFDDFWDLIFNAT
jgi:hypothetical protein